MASTVGARTGMQGVFLVAAELAKRDFIVSVTSRNAFGADLLITDQACQKAWSVQVKTNRKNASFWLVGKHASTLVSPHHVYVLVNLRGEERPDCYILPSEELAGLVRTEERPNSTFYFVNRNDVKKYQGEWGPFGNPASEVARRI